MSKNTTKSMTNSRNVNVTINNHRHGNKNDVSNNIFCDNEENHDANPNNFRHAPTAESLNTQQLPSILCNRRLPSEGRGGRGGRGGRLRSNLQRNPTNTTNMDDQQGKNPTNMNNE